MRIKRRRIIQSAVTALAGSSLGLSSGSAAQTQTAFNHHPKGFHWNKRNLKRRPNILIAVLDDVGFSDFGCYGSELNTSCIDRLASEGAKFNNFHVTALCAPTRACLLTGRNAHAVGVGNIAEWGRDLPGYKGWIRQDAATLAEILKPLDYTTLAIGKWHLSSIEDQNATGPYDRWPIGRGFDRWYGFHGNAMDHFHPELFENNIEAHPDKAGGYHLSADLIDHGIQYIQDHITAAPDNPFFMYLAFGACHFPFHAPADYIARHKGHYDQGWDRLRLERFRMQHELGVIPEDARLAPRNEGVADWESLSDTERRIAARGQEVYAAFLEHTDDQLQRLVDFLAAEKQLDDTIVVVLSDNGAAVSSQPLGTLDLRRSAYIDKESTQHLSKYLDKMGTEDSQCEYAPGWAQASNTPLKWYKGDTYGGGTRSPLVVHWPNGKIPANLIAEQYHHAIDVVPSLLEMIDASLPEVVNCQSPLPLQGTSFAYAFDNPQAPTSKAIQYFETSGDRAIWVDGWKAVVRHRGGSSFEDDVWELYHTDSDFSETANLAAKEAARLNQMIALWQAEAERYDVLPMSDDLLGLYKKSLPKPRARYIFYPGMTRLDRLSAPDIYHYNSQITADVELSGGKANGVILASGDSSIGYELYVKNGVLIFSYVYTRGRVYTLESTQRIPPGEHLLGLRIDKTGQHSARATLLMNDKTIGARDIPKMWPVYAPNAGIRCGANRGAPISKAYSGPFVFNQRINRVIVDIFLGALSRSPAAFTAPYS